MIKEVVTVKLESNVEEAARIMMTESVTCSVRHGQRAGGHRHRLGRLRGRGLEADPAGGRLPVSATVMLWMTRSFVASCEKM